MKAFEVRYELSPQSHGEKPALGIETVFAGSSYEAAEKVAKEHNTRVNCREFWVESVREIEPQSQPA